MGFGGATSGRRGGSSQQDRRDMEQMRLIAEMLDGSIRDVPSLCDYEDLRKSGTVRRFRKLGVEQ